MDTLKFRFARRIFSDHFTILVGAALCVLSGFAAEAQRLPQTVRPEHYKLSLIPDLKAATFSGAESIDVVLSQPSKTITVNAVEITFKSVTATAEGAAPTPGVATLDSDKEQATFTFPAELPAGKIRLAIDYTGILNGKLRGFYLSKTAKRNYAVTQFEATDARRGFPSFDEPAFKATFDVSLTVDAADTVISNTNILSDKPAASVDGAAKHTLTFATTPKMSTYLVAFLVGDFECISGESDGIPIRVCATPGQAKMGRFALSTAEYVLHYYNHYFGIKYPMPKLDLIAIPDFEAGAMENFGAITYRETALLVDEKTAPLDQKKGVASVVAHEMAHQWFGDLVTMQWWDNIWLNEGFATWMSSKPVEAWHPEWHGERDNASSLDGTLAQDARRTTHAITAKAETPGEINEMFDGISYNKGAAVLAMVENYLGEETFRQGVHNYLAAHLYSNATSEDFWNSQTATSGKPVDKIMTSLVFQPGVPLLTFTAVDTGTATVAQRRFYGDLNTKTDANQSWTLPVCFKTASKPACELVTSAEQHLKTPAFSLVYANAGAKGYYRTAYPKAVYEDIVAHAETSLTPEERITVIGDEWALMRGGLVSIGDNLNLLAALHNDPNPEVLEVALETPGAALNIASTEEERMKLNAWVRKEFSPVYTALGPAPTGGQVEPEEKKQIRALLFGILGQAKDPVVLAEAKTLANKYIADQTSVEPAIAQSAVAIAATNGDAQLYDQLIKLSASSPSPAVQESALFSTARFTDPTLVARTLDSVASGKVRNQDSYVLLLFLLGDRKTREQAWTYITQHWESIHAQLTISSGASLVRAAGNFCSKQKHDEVLSFFNTHKVEAADRALRSTDESINRCVQLREAQEPALKEWLATH